MKKLLLFLLVLAGGVSTASAQITESGYKKVYVHDNTTVNWSSFKLHFFNNTEPESGDIAEESSTETIDGNTWHVFKIPASYSKDIKIVLHNGDNWNGNQQSTNFEGAIWGDTFFEMYHDGNAKNKTWVEKQIRYYMIKDTEPETPTKLTKNGDTWEITIQENNNFKFSIVNNWAYQSGSFSWDAKQNIYRPRGDSQHVYLGFSNGFTNYGFSKELSDGNWIINTDNTVLHRLSFTFTNSGWDAGTFTDKPSFSRTISAVSTEGYATFSSPYDVKIPAELTAYYGKTVNGAGAVVMAPIENANNEVYHGDGILLKGTAGNTYEFTPAENSPSTISGNLLVGVPSTNTTVPTSNEDDYYYVYGKDVAGLGFYKVISDITCPAGNAYLHTTTALATTLGARVAMVFDENESTGINTVKSINSNMDSYYTLQGHRVAKPTKGLYIVNGKKYVK